MSPAEAVFAALLVILGAGTLVCIIASLVRTGGQEAVQDAPRVATCSGCNARTGHRPLCPETPTVVASEDLTWQVDLAMIYADYDTYRTELRLPGERAS